MKQIAFIVSLILAASSISCAQGYKIDINFNAYNDTVILGHYRAGQLVPDDTVITNSRGKATFQGNENLPGGMYFLFFSNRKNLDFLIDTEQTFSISGDTSNFASATFSDAQNKLFTEYQKEMHRINREMRTLQEQRPHAADPSAVDAQIHAKRTELESIFNKTIEENSDMFFADFLRATREPQIPPHITDDRGRYFYYRNHYFDNFDYSDARLMRTPIYENKIETYIERLLPQLPDTLIEAADKFIEASRGDEEHFKYMLRFLFNKYAASQLMAAENVHLHIAEKYFIPEATWSTPEFINRLKETVARKKRCLVGAKAHNIDYRLMPTDIGKIKEFSERVEHYKKAGLNAESRLDESAAYNRKAELLSQWLAEHRQAESLHELDAEYIILWFWTPDCSHCRTASPKFHDDYVEKGLKEKKVEIIAIYLNKDIKDWTDFTKEHKRWVDFLAEHELTGWKNVWNPFDNFRTNFDIQSSPVLYVLDKDKKIIAKRIGYEQALEVIEAELAQ